VRAAASALSKQAALFRNAARHLLPERQEEFMEAERKKDHDYSATEDEADDEEETDKDDDLDEEDLAEDDTEEVEGSMQDNVRNIRGRKVEDLTSEDLINRDTDGEGEDENLVPPRSNEKVSVNQ